MISQLRARRSGVVVNVQRNTCPQPLAAAYTASKMAIEGFTGSLAHELLVFGVRAKLVEPGYGPTTRIAKNTDLRLEELIPEAYTSFAQSIFAEFAKPKMITKEIDVAEPGWQAANDATGKLCSPPVLMLWRPRAQAEVSPPLNGPSNEGRPHRNLHRHSAR